MLYYTIIAEGVICALLALFAWRNRAERGTRAFLVLMLGVMIWCLAYAQELHSNELPAKILWSKIEYLGIVTVPVAWLAFALEYTERQRWLTRGRLALLATPSLLTLLLVWTNETHGMIWRTISLVPKLDFVGWEAMYGPGFWLFTAYAYAMLLIGTLLLIQVCVLRPALYRGQAGTLLVGSLFPWLGNLLYNVGLSPLPGAEISPLSFTITGLIFTWALWRWQLFDIVPVARDRVIERMRDGVIVLDAQGRVVDVNPAACQINGWERRVVLGQPIMPILGQHAAAVEPLLTTEEVDAQIAVEVAGDPRVFQVWISPLPDRLGTPGGRLVILSDITRLKQVEQELIRAKQVAEAANAAKSIFLATMSHEIRTPISGVLGMANLLLEADLNAPQHELAQMIHASGDQLLRVINMILDFSKIEAGQLELEAQPFDLRACVESSLDMVATTAAQKGLELTYLIAPGTPIALVQDPTRLRQILVNLLSNAVKFTQYGEVALNVTREGLRDDPALPETLTFAVRDTGIGIPPNRMDRLFRSFSQADAATTRTHGGTGLGLAICKLLVTAMGGTLTVESTPGAGTTFTFSIRAARNLEGVPGDGDVDHPELRGRRALIVDDRASSRQTLATQLGVWGMQATVAESGAAALAILHGGVSFDLAILDVQMPDMSGVALAEALRRSVVYQSLPIILLTALGAMSPRSGDPITIALSKPVKISRLCQQIMSLLATNVPPSPAPGRAERRPLPPADVTMAQQHPLRILVAEDNAINQQMLLRMLARLGYQANLVINGQAAVDALGQQRYDLVLMDVQMPEMDGLEATRTIRATLPRAQQPWIIAVTAGATQGDRETCLTAGMDDFLVKPLDREALTDAIRRCRPLVDVQAQPEDPGVAAVIDPAALRNLVRTLGDQDNTILTALIATFIESADTIQASARAALGHHDAPTLRRAMHTLKSNASTFGAQPLTALCRDMERRAADGDLEGADAALDAVAAELCRVQAALSVL